MLSLLLYDIRGEEEQLFSDGTLTVICQENPDSYLRYAVLADGSFGCTSRLVTGWLHKSPRQLGQMRSPDISVLGLCAKTVVVGEDCFRKA